VGNGGGATLQSYGATKEMSTPEVMNLVPGGHLTFLSLLLSWHDDGLRFFVHGGVPAERHPAEVDRDIIEWILYRNRRNRDHMANAPEVPHSSGRHIVHGHDQVESVLQLSHRTALDCGAYFSNRLAVGEFTSEIARVYKVHYIS